MSRNQILTIRELADFLKIVEKTAYRFVPEVKIFLFTVSAAWRFERVKVESWIKRWCKFF